MAEPKRVLQVVGGMDTGGIETLIMSIYRVIDRERVQFDFLLPSGRDYFYNPEIRRLGGRIFHIGASRKRPHASLDALKAFFLERPYDVVHVHKGSLDSPFHLRAAMEVGVSTRIIHSHCAFPRVKGPRDAANRLVHGWCERGLPRLATDFFACSTDAARWFGFDRLPDPPGWRLVRNGVDTRRFAFDPAKRASARAELGIGEGEFVVGNVGRLSPQKNQVWFCEVFAGLLEVRPGSRWLLVGSGPLEGEIRARCESLGVWGRVIHLEGRGDVDRLLCAMDAFAFPSLYEGLGIAFVEAQASGLPSFASDTIPREGFVTSTVGALPIDRGVAPWVDALASVPVGARVRDAAEEVRAAGFDIRSTAERLQAFYLPRLGGGVA